MAPRRARFIALTARLADHPHVADPTEATVNGYIQVDGRIITNPRAQVRADAAIRVVRPIPLRGARKLGTALDALQIDPAGLVAVDIGAAAGGFTLALLRRGARCVYAVDVGHGQLRGSLRQDHRVVNLERTNVADLNFDLVSEPIHLITMDLSYLPVAEAVGQLEGLAIAMQAQLVALVKPTFELSRNRLETAPALVHDALIRATSAVETGQWSVVGITIPAVTGAGGAVEAFVHARRR